MSLSDVDDMGARFQRVIHDDARAAFEAFAAGQGLTVSEEMRLAFEVGVDLGAAITARRLTEGRPVQ